MDKTPSQIVFEELATWDKNSPQVWDDASQEWHHKCEEIAVAVVAHARPQIEAEAQTEIDRWKEDSQRQAKTIQRMYGAAIDRNTVDEAREKAHQQDLAEARAAAIADAFRMLCLFAMDGNGVTPETISKFKDFISGLATMPSGHVVVPVEPDAKQRCAGIEAANIYGANAEEIYKAMIAARKP
jgi:hypothetical protein